MDRRKKRMTRLCALYLMAALFFPVSAFAAEQSMQLTATVPSSHSVRLEIDEHASVKADGKIYTGTQSIQVERLKEQKYVIQAEDGYEITEVTYGPEGEAEEITLTGSAFTAPALNQDGNILTVTVEEEAEETKSSPPTGTTTGKTSTKDTTSQAVKTGDETTLLLPVTGMTAALAAIAICGFSIRKRRHGYH